MFVRQGHWWYQSITLHNPTTKEQELLRNTFSLFKEDSIQCLLDHLRGSEPIVTDENVGWFEDGFSEPFQPYFIPNRVHLQKCVMDCLLIIVQSTISEKCETMLVKVLSRIALARSHSIIPPELTPKFSLFICQFISSPVKLRLMRRTQQEHGLKWSLMEFLVDSCQPSQTPSEHSQIVLARPPPLLISAIDEINTRFSISDLSRYLSTPPDLTTDEDKDSPARTDLAFDVLFLSLLSIVSDEEFHKPARRLLARMFEMLEGELERLLLEREVRRGDLEMEWLGSGRTKEDTLSFAEGVWMLLGRRETEEERDDDTTKTDKDETNEEETEQESESVEYPRTVRNDTLPALSSAPTVFLHRVACLLISTLFSTASDCLPSNHQPTASTDTSHNDRDSTDTSASEPTNNKMNESHLFRICLKLTGWLHTTFETLTSNHVSTTSLRMDVESAVSLVFLLLPHAELDSQCFLVSLLRHLSRFIRMEPSVITPDLVRKVALFFARLGPSLPHQLVRSVEYGVKWMMSGSSPSQSGPYLEEAAELCRPILGDLVSRLESDVEGRREIAAQIWVIVSSNDYYLLRYSSPLAPLLSVLSDATDNDEAFFILRACTRTVAKASFDDTSLISVLLQHSSILLRFVKRMSRPQVVTEAWRLLLQLLVIVTRLFANPRDRETTFLNISKRIVTEFVKTVENALRIRGQTQKTVGKEAEFNVLLRFLGSSFVHFHNVFDIDFSALILSLIPTLTPLQFYQRHEDSLWLYRYPYPRTPLSSFKPPKPFRFIRTSPSFPSEQSVCRDVLRSTIAAVESIIRTPVNGNLPDLCERDRSVLLMCESIRNPFRVKMALECAIRLPRLLHNAVPFHRATLSQIEQGADQKLLSKMFDRASKIVSTVNLELLTTFPLYFCLSSHIDAGLIRWALTDGNRRDSLPPTNEEDSSPSEMGVSISENLQFAAMWMLNGMVEFPFSDPKKWGDNNIPFLWKMMLHSILLHPPFDPSIARTAIKLRVCLSEEGVEDAVTLNIHLAAVMVEALFHDEPDHLDTLKIAFEIEMRPDNMFKGQIVSVNLELMSSHSAEPAFEPHDSVIIGNLAEDVKKEDLEVFFAPIAVNVECSVFFDENKNSRGFGFAKFENEELAKKAVDEMNGKDLRGKQLKLSIARTKKERIAYKKKLMEQTKWRDLYIRNFPLTFTDEDFRALFEPYGKVTTCKLVRSEDGTSRGFGFCCFENKEDARECLLRLSETEIQGQRLQINYVQRDRMPTRPAQHHMGSSLEHRASQHPESTLPTGFDMNEYGEMADEEKEQYIHQFLFHKVVQRDIKRAGQITDFILSLGLQESFTLLQNDSGLARKIREAQMML
ncbi:putative Polyadenylate-binding protein [Blattamonas nauphoetae]|uniref:Polyadenylate-binding protein n=1 Tax=Blattamonas nauphoetae TaxID=2049346 RepID=A0ABQ9XFJ5_9EUKA|nr:putative Polyadenylate-binding protein [Blattamonas nauphoetae]